ncbi:anti-sigma factor [Nonomuraea sp. NPDC049714]|uniref:anti-sigma factor n=1 Tax=Nonomuraea sp. NPDC049714 TaxID=3364357 RepID=UPI0037B08EA1
MHRLREGAARLALTTATTPPAPLRPRILAAAHLVRPPHSDVVTQVGPVGGDVAARVVRPPRRDVVTHVVGGPTGDGHAAARTVTEWDATFAYVPGSQPPPTSPTTGTAGGPPPPRASSELAPATGSPSGAVGGDMTVAGVPFRGWDGRSEPDAGQVDVSSLRRRWRAKAMAGVAAVAVAAAVALGVLGFDARRDLGELRARDAAIAAVLAAPDAQTVRQPVKVGGTAVFVVSREQGRMLFTTSDLPELPAAGTYQLWLMGPDGARPAGFVNRREDGSTAPVLTRPLPGDAQVGLTIEPAGGSDQPTTHPILLAELPRA